MPFYTLKNALRSIREWLTVFVKSEYWTNLLVMEKSAHQAMSKGQIAERFGIHPETLRNWCRRHQIAEKLNMDHDTFRRIMLFTPGQAKAILEYFEGSQPISSNKQAV